MPESYELQRIPAIKEFVFLFLSEIGFIIKQFQMGYGKHALKLLKDYYEGKFTSLDETADSDDNDGLLFMLTFVTI